MNAPVETGWVEANQRSLATEIGRLRAFLEDYIGRGGGPQAPTPRPASRHDCKALDFLQERFALSPFERDTLLLAAAVELDASFAALCRQAQGGAPRPCASFGLALAALPDAHWSALSPDAPLRRWCLAQPAEGQPLVSAPLAIDERILHFVAGIDCRDPHLPGLRTLPVQDELDADRLAHARELAALWKKAEGAPPVLHVKSTDPTLARSVAARACAELRIGLLALRAEEVPVDNTARASFARRVTRECVLQDAALLLEVGEAPSPSAAALLDELECALIVSGTLAQVPLRRVLRFEPPVSLRGAISATARERALDELSALAQHIEPRATWNDLVLPEAQMTILRDICRQARHRTKVHEEWGFASKGARGLGLAVCFTGESGTGKTLAAEVLAGPEGLGLDLYRIDLSALVSKYIGETEKNVKRVFDAAENSGAVLLFDEADALFGKRSSVKDSHDRYANIEIAYLLQQMDSYRWVSILTTNMKASLDPAFLRRIRFVVQFPFPDAASRARIWKRILPDQLPRKGIDVERLARLSLSGGNLRNIALNAAFHAAEDGTPLTHAHLLLAARAEYAKLEKPLTDAEIGGLR